MLASEALAARTLGEGDAISATSRWRGSSPKTSRCRRASLERTVTDSAEAVNGADAVLLA